MWHFPAGSSRFMALDTIARDLSREWTEEWSRLRPTLLYTIRVTLALGLALWSAAFLQLPSPISAMATVLIVANPLSGALISKSFWRLFGTVVGAFFSVALMAVAPQQPVLFFAGLALVVGAACCVATLLRFFRAYAAVLSAYTIILVSASTFSDPDAIFMSAVWRLSAVALGVISTALVFLVTTVSAPQRLLTRINIVLHDMVVQFASSKPQAAPREDDPGQVAAFRGLEPKEYDSRARLLTQVGALHEAIEYGAADNFDINRRSGGLRVGVSRLLGLLSTHHPAWRNLPTGDVPELAEARGLVRDLMRDLADMPTDTLVRHDFATFHGRIEQTAHALDRLALEVTDMTGLAAIDSERDIVAQLDMAVANLTNRHKRRTDSRLRPFFEWPAALRNGARGILITLMGCLAWYVLGWANGPDMLIYLIAASSLLSTSPSATRGATMLATGTALAIPGTFIFQTLILPQIDGFVLLWLSLVLCMLPGIWIQFHPRYALLGFGYAVFFNLMIQVSNPVSFNDRALFNNWLAFAIATVALVLVFRVILPADQRLDSARLISSLCKAVQRLARMPARHRLDWSGWEHLQMQKILRLIQRLSYVTPQPRVFEVTDAALGAVSLGRVVMRLRFLLDQGQLHEASREDAIRALAGFRDLRRDPAKTSRILRVASAAIASRIDPGIHPAQDRLLDNARRIAAALLQAAHLIDAAPGFFHKNGPMQCAADHRCADFSLELPVTRRNPSRSSGPLTGTGR